MGKKYRDANWLEKKYWGEGLTTNDIAEICDVYRSTIVRWMDRLDVETRDVSDYDQKELTRPAREAAKEKYGEGGSLAHLWEERTDEMLGWVAENGALGAEAREENGMAGVTGEDNPRWNSVKTECANCGSEVVRKQSAFDKYENHFCNGECYGEWVSENRLGQDHPRWTGGKSVYDAVKKQLPGETWLNKHKKAKESDGYICQLCGSIGKEMHTHHIIPLMYGGTNEDWNLMTVCEDCHRTVETYTKSIPEIEPVLVE